MNNRDYDYIEARLLAPANDLSEAIDRLRKIGGHREQAAQLMEALKTLIDECRAVRTYLALERNQQIEKHYEMLSHFK